MGYPRADATLGLLSLVGALALAGCGRSGGTTAVGPAPPAAATASSAATPDLLPSLPDPASDVRPDAVKLEEAAARLQRLQDRLGAADTRLIAEVRAALQASHEAEAHAAIARYLATLAADASGVPAPRLAGCDAAALAPLQQGLDALARQRADRTAKARALSTLSYRPLSLADLAPLAPQQAPDADAREVSDAATRMRSQASACAAAASHVRPARPARPRQAAPSIAYQPASPGSSPPRPAPAVPAPAASPGAASPAAPPKPHKNLLERIFGGGRSGP